MAKQNPTCLLIGVFILMTAVFASIVLYINLVGDRDVLNRIREIRPGSSKTEVRELLDGEPQICTARGAPGWIIDVVGEQEQGEYWYLFTGYPPRNLIIYFNEDEKVGFVTWAPT